MFKEVLRNTDLTVWAIAGLVIFFFTFIAIVAWTLRKPKATVDRWANVPLSDDPVDPFEDSATQTPTKAQPHA